MVPISTSPWLSDDDLHWWNEGTHGRAYRRLGAHPRVVDGTAGIQFAVWAPNAERVSVIGDWNRWDGTATPMVSRGASGVWEAFVPGVRIGDRYKYRIRSRVRGYQVDKADPFGFRHETPPATASVVWHHAYAWGDAEWMATRRARNVHSAPISIYELHLGSWMRMAEEGNRWLGYRELAPRLVEHVLRLGFTHVEFMPVMEHPFYGSWGYQVTGYFATTSRYGSPQDFMFLVDTLHRHGIGVILDWVPAHFPMDEHGLVYFDGTHLFEHSDRRQGFHPDWKSAIFNYGRNEVRSFLLSSALFWLDVFHADGLRVDGVASMLYLDYSRRPGEWIPNRFGGRENLEAIELIRRLNEEVYREVPDCITIAEESTAWPMVSRPTHRGGLGFGMKWDMGWMHDTLRYMGMDPLFRKYHQDGLTFRFVYQFNENFVMPLSHDEVVHGKRSILGKMPGDPWKQRANLRLLLAYMFACPGKKLLFMGVELGQGEEWRHEGSVSWHLLGRPEHAAIAELVTVLNRLYRELPALHELDHEGEGFDWITSDRELSVVAFGRRAIDGSTALVVCNFTPVPRYDYRVGVRLPGRWREVLNTDAREFGGSGVGNMGFADTKPGPWHDRPYVLRLALPPLGVVMLTHDGVVEVPAGDEDTEAALEDIVASP